jgi:hypothetical protein
VERQARWFERRWRKDEYLPSEYALRFALALIDTGPSLKIHYIVCHASEKLVQLTRIISSEVTEHKSSRFIVYFATGACVDYFYRVCSCKQLFECPDHRFLDLTRHPTSGDGVILAARPSSSFCTNTDPGSIFRCPGHNRFSIRSLGY